MRQREKHTGGNDGDVDRMDPGDDSDDADDTPASRKERKRKRAQERKDEFSQGVLDKFEKSEMYKLIDKVYVPPYALK